MNKYQKTIKRKNKYREFIKVLNGILKLSARQVDILVAVMEIDSTMSDEEFEEKGLINRRTRKKIMLDENIVKTNLSRFMASFKELGIIVETNEGKLYLNPLFKPKEEPDRITVEFILQYID